LITDYFFPGLGWSLYSSHTWRPLEVEICSHELSWLSLWGCTNKLISFSYWFGYLSLFSLCWLWSHFCVQVDDDRELLFVHERGKKRLMEGSRVAFKG